MPPPSQAQAPLVGHSMGGVRAFPRLLVSTAYCCGPGRRRDIRDRRGPPAFLNAPPEPEAAASRVKPKTNLRSAHWGIHILCVHFQEYVIFFEALVFLTMQVPQDIVDAIIDNFAMSHDEKISLPRYWREPDDADSLRACSFTSRSFLHRSRMHLFAAFSCLWLSDFSHFDRLLTESPHIGELYVRYFKLEIGNHIAPLLTEDVVLPRILSRLPRLTHVSLHYFSTYGDWPPLFKAGMRATLTLHCLRSVCLYSMHFANASELELLLSHATGLKALTLGQITFDNPSVCHIDRHEVHVFLESLELALEMEEVDAIVSGFSTVDIKHLKSLVANFLPAIPLLRANAQTIQTIQITLSYYLRVLGPPDPGILKGNQTLRSIEIAEHSSRMISIFQQFGHLGHLKALKTISLDFADEAEYVSSNTVDWPELDAILSPAVDGLEDIHIHNHCCRLWGRRLRCMFIENRLFEFIENRLIEFIENEDRWNAELTKDSGEWAEISCSSLYLY
ncbi:hypothetical protein C8J57DRAFT_1469834 [Mycena rebaudengoi]|nr:hypothetical protein C8J57DRAFT_1469834 [Mycena rebaudengoi]